MLTTAGISFGHNLAWKAALFIIFLGTSGENSISPRIFQYESELEARYGIKVDERLQWRKMVDTGAVQKERWLPEDSTSLYEPRASSTARRAVPACGHIWSTTIKGLWPCEARVKRKWHVANDQRSGEMHYLPKRNKEKEGSGPRCRG